MRPHASIWVVIGLIASFCALIPYRSLCILMSPFGSMFVLMRLMSSYWSSSVLMRFMSPHWSSCVLTYPNGSL